MKWTKWACLLAGMMIWSGCGNMDNPEPTEDESAGGVYEYVPQGKADNYRSTEGREYLLTGTDTIDLSAEEDAQLTGEEREERVQELVEYKFKALSYFLYAYLADKSSHDENADYGGFRTTIRQQTFESLAIEEVDGEPGTYRFEFQAEAGGPMELVERIPRDVNGKFELILPKLTNSELESGSYSREYRHFTPEDYEESELTSLEMGIEPQESEPDAYPEYNQMFQDGLLDVAIHVGGDYNDKRYDIETAEELFRTLQRDLDLEAPVESIEELESDSGPFVGSFEANGETIDLEVTLIYPEMHDEPGVGYDGLLELYRESASEKDIVIYDGHAGYTSSYSGVVVHYDPRHAIAADDFDELELPDKHQLFVFNGCKTYTSYADAMYDHPAKDAANLDIMTTVNFSWLSEMTRVTTDLLDNFLDQKAGTHAPRSYDHILAEMNKGRSWDVIYGVHGLDDNPHRSPYAQTDSLCRSCGDSTDCPGVDNVCLNLSGGQACTVACTADSGCPDGYACESVARQGSDLISAKQCVPTAGMCR